MALNPRYVTAPGLQEYYVDKVTGLPLSGGKIYYYRDTNRTQFKSVYSLQGNTANYTYVPLPNPVILSSVGTVQDNNRNDIKPYYYPVDENGDLDLYFIRVYNSAGVHQFDRQAWPNPNIDTQPLGSDDRFNYIPNGQLLAHTVLPDNDLLPGTNIIAQGGFTVELDDNATSVNKLEFLDQQFTQAPPQSPRYVMQFTCNTFNALEVNKSIRIKWTDVNKFSTKPSVYRYAFWANSNVAIPIAIKVVKYFGAGGSTFVPVTQDLAIITTASNSTLYQFTIDFGLNAGYIVDDVTQDDYVALDISLPTNIGFVAKFSDFVLVEGDAVVANFPVQTDADMMARGVFGWANKIDPNGYDLYLPPILTKRGMTWDRGQIGEVGMSLVPILSPSDPIGPDDNRMPADGAIYITSEYATNGIPFRRFLDFLLYADSFAAGNGAPLYGTGANFVTALINKSGALPTHFRLTYNVAGVSSTLATAGTSGFTVTNNFTFNGSTTGTASFNWLASNTGTANSLLLATLLQNATVSFILKDAGDSDFTFTDSQNLTPFLGAATSHNDSSTVLNTVSGESLVKAGTGRYFRLQITGGSIQVFWFNVGGANTAPAPGGTLNEIKVDATMSAADVANVVREALNAYNSTEITCIGSPVDGSYFLFYSNPTLIRSFYVWYAYTETSIDPAVPGATGIKVTLPDSPSANTVRDLTRAAINSYQFQAPAFQGMFPRFADPDGIWDTNTNLRWSYTAGVGGPVPGTYEYQMFLSHDHTSALYNTDNVGFSGAKGVANIDPQPALPTTYSGSSETRPVNTTVYPFVRY